MDSTLKDIPSAEQGEGQLATTGQEAAKGTYLQAVPAVEQATRILFMLANSVSGEASVTEVARETGISRSKALAILNTLRTAGLIGRNERNKCYHLGPNVLLLSRGFVNHTDLGQSATPYIEELAATTRCTVFLGVISGDTLFVVALRHAPEVGFCALAIGHRYLLTWGAHGRAILASMPSEELERRLGGRAQFDAGQTGKDAIEVDQLRAEIDEARRRGYGVSLGTTWSGVNAVSAVLTVGTSEPTLPEASRVAGCLVAVGNFATEQVEEIGQLVVAMAAEISVELGPLLETVNPHFPFSHPLS